MYALDSSTCQKPVTITGYQMRLITDSQFSKALTEVIEWVIAMKQIVYAMIVRAADGMALSESIDCDDHPAVQSTKKYLKAIAKQVKNLEDRCSMAINETHALHITKALGVSYLALCKSTYPVVLAFSFLDELVKEFITTYTVGDVRAALRPYAFIQFDAVVQKTKQRYNNPNSLVTKVNLSNLSLEIRLRPPNQVFLTDFVPMSNGMSGLNVSFPNTVGPRPKRKPLNAFDRVALFVTCLCGLFSFIRGILALNESGFENYDDKNPFHGFLFIFEASVQCFQMFLLLNSLRRQLLLTGLSLLAVCVCNVLAWDVRDLWQSLLYATVEVSLAICVIMQRREEKTSNYNI